MAITLSVQSDTDQEQRLMMPGTYDWQQFKALESLLAESSGLRITYLDGWIELMTLGEPHELIKSLLGMFLETYFIEMGIEFIPVGSATRRGEEKKTSFEPDESYYLGEKKDNPDLAIEVILSSGSLHKLEKYRRFQIPEVWLWEDNQLRIYFFQNGDYQEVKQSQLLPDLKIDLIVRCVQISSRLEAMRVFKDELRHNERLGK
ncbi:Uma2 family endonuclease [Pseudanabaena sp. FACHB-1998]|uniref:Uma2 family endonuclease n=1 Tax=Pseudanabaena sp. FACHB-1998 TaxID=2692858 RepID=UPI001681AA3B|nr:Uma2 family endonuclease [Pseudanabaena sp. FACHB-1998]MBD2178873.1 Uma2 family endonuclease [Pseudanabaena sp. FACHB-1998]